MTRKYRLERTAFIGCRNTAYMDVDDAEPCPFCGSRQVTIYPYGREPPRMSRAYLRLDDEGRKRVIEEIEYQTSRMMKEREEERRAWLSKDI